MNEEEEYFEVPIQAFVPVVKGDKTWESVKCVYIKYQRVLNKMDGCGARPWDELRPNVQKAWLSMCLNMGWVFDAPVRHIPDKLGD